jgi:hypothetical protein
VPDTVTVTNATTNTAAWAAGETYVYRENNYSETEQQQQQQQQWIVIAVCELTKSWEGNVD